MYFIFAFLTTKSFHSRKKELPYLDIIINIKTIYFPPFKDLYSYK